MDYFKTAKLPALIIAAFIIFHCHSAIGDELQQEPSAPGQEVKSSVTRSENSPSNDEQSETVPPEKGENIKSLGLPMVWKPYADALFNWDRRGNDDYGGDW